MDKLRRKAVLLGVAWAVSPAQAQQVGDWNVGGFVDQVLFSTTDNNYFGKTDDSISSEIHELGLIGRGPLASNWEFSGQILSRDAGATDNDSPRLDFAFFTYTLFETIDWTGAVRFGRVKRPSTIYSDSRSSPFSRPGIFMPQSTYYDRIRNVLVSYDGTDAVLEKRQDLSSYAVHAGLGLARPIEEELDDLFIIKGAMLGHLRPRNTHHVQCVYDYDSGHFRVIGTYFKIHYNYDPISADSTLPDGRRNLLNWPGEFYFSGKSLGVEYNDPSWSLTTELVEANTLFNGFAAFFRPLPIVSRGGYAQFNYHLSTTAQIYIRYDESHLDETDVYATSVLYQMAGFKHWATTFYDRTLGVSWLVSPKLQMRSEFHLVKGTGYLNIGDTESPAELRKNWHLAAFEIAYRF